MVAGDPDIGADVVLTALNMADYEVVYVESTEDIDEIMAAWRAFRPQPHAHPPACRCDRCQAHTDRGSAQLGRWGGSLPSLSQGQGHSSRTTHSGSSADGADGG